MVFADETPLAHRMKVAHRFARNLFWLTTTQFLALGAGFFTVVYAARALGDVAFGQISFAQNVINYLLLITDFGFTTKAVPLLAKARERTAELADVIVSLRLALAALATAVTMIALLFAPGAETKKLVVLLFVLTVSPAVFDFSWVFSAHEKMRPVGLLQLFRNAATLILLVTFLRFNANVVTAAGIYLIVAVATAGLSFIWYRQSFGKLRLRFSWSSTKPFLDLALPLGLSLLMIRLYYGSDIFFLSYFFGDQMVGWYNAGFKITNVLIMIAGFYGSVLLPTLSHQLARSAENARNIMYQSWRILLAVVLPVLIVGGVFADEMMALIYGPAFLPGAAPFRWLLVATGIVFAAVVFTNGMIAFEMQKFFLGLVAATAAVNLLLNYFVIPRFAMTGAALTAALAQAMVLAGGIYALRSHVDLKHIGAATFKILSAAALMALTLLMLRPLNVFAAIAGGGVVYIAGLITLGVLQRNDWTQLADFFRSRQSGAGISE